MIYWAGVSSDDVNVIVERYPDQVIPGRKHETESVPGRNGDILYTEKAFSNYEQPYDVYLSAEEQRFPLAARRVAEWLMSPEGYQKLQDSYTLDTFRLAYFAGPLDVENIMNRFGRCKLAFNCKPQRFLVSGDTNIAISDSGTPITNPTRNTALPLIKVYGNGAGELNVGGITVHILSMIGYMVLDCELMDAYKEMQNVNGSIYAPYFPTLQPGTTNITWSGGITGIEIKPRWWTL